MTAVRFHFIPSANTGLTGSGLGQEPGSRPALLTALSREEALGEVTLQLSAPTLHGKVD